MLSVCIKFAIHTNQTSGYIKYVKISIIILHTAVSATSDSMSNIYWSGLRSTFAGRNLGISMKPL